MASVTTPRINKIIRLNNYDLLGTDCVKYNMYMCLDTLQLWYDESDSKRVLYSYVSVDTVNDLQNNLIPELGTTYYCWESNSLWLWMNRWICIYSDNKYPSAYRTDNNYIQEVYVDDENPTIVDNNGLLRDGSVVIRDANRVIKGRMFVSDTHDNLVFSSFLGGGIRLLPNGAFSSSGELYIDDDEKSFIRAEWTARNNEMYVDYSEKPTQDPSKYITDTHKYRVWHSGNLKIEDFELNGLNIYNKLIEAQADGSLPDPLLLNVDKVDGLHASDLALKNHVHASNDISDFATASKAVVENSLRDRLTNMIFKGAKITWVEASQKFMLSTDNFILTLTGGATGQATVTNNSNTTLAVTVDPTKHVHSDLDARITALEAGGGSGGDLTNYYTKTETDSLIDSYFTTTPTDGKAILVDSTGTLPANAKTASDLDHDTAFSLTGDITGSVTFGYDKTTLSMTTSASNVISSTAEANKALKLDGNKVLQATSASAKKLDHNIKIELKQDVTGSVTTDLSGNTVTINTTIANTDVLKKTDIGTILADLDSNGKIKDIYLPEQSVGGFKLVGMWSGSSAPSSSPQAGYAWLVTADSTFSGINFKQGDWIYYYNSSWNRADVSNGVHSVNGKTGNAVTLTYSDVNAISDTYINYTAGTTIPANKVVVTDTAGHIAGATVDKLTNKYEFKTATNGDIKVDTANSTATKTDGSNDLNVKLIITDTGYSNIANKTQRTVQYNGSNQPFRKNIDFAGGFDFTDNGSDTLSLDFTDMTINELTIDAGIYAKNNNTQNIGTSAAKFANVYATNFKGNADTATKATNDSDGNKISDTYLKKAGGTLSGDIKFSAVTSTSYPAVSNSISWSGSTDGVKLYFQVDSSDNGHLVIESQDNNNDGVIFKNSDTGNTASITNGKFIGDLTGNADTATKLKASKKINDTAFDGSADITTSKWGTARNVGIVNSDGTGTATTVSVNGSANVNLKLPASAKFTGLTTTTLSVNGHKLFIQSGTPSGASTNDVWIKI